MVGVALLIGAAAFRVWDAGPVTVIATRAGADALSLQPPSGDPVTSFRIVLDNGSAKSPAGHHTPVP